MGELFLKHDLYLCSLSDIKRLDKSIVKVFIARVPIKNMEKYDMHHMSILSPSQKLFVDMKIKKNITWKDYVWRYRQEMINNKRALDFIYNKLEESSIALICYCHDNHCHRYILGNYFSELGINVIKKGESN